MLRVWLSQTPSSPLILTVQHNKVNHNLYVQHDLFMQLLHQGCFAYTVLLVVVVCQKG